MTIRICSALLLFLTGCATAESDYLGLELPKGLNEVSGLTARGEALFAIGDERGLVYRVSFADGRVSKWLSFGDKPVKGDFEGLAVYGNSLYAITSDGDLYESDLVEGTTAYRKQSTGLGEMCEIEGLTVWPGNDVLMVLCKKPRVDALKKKLTLFAWSPTRNERVSELDINIGFGDLEVNKLHPSGVAFAPDGRLFVVAARQSVLLALDPESGHSSLRLLPNTSLHPQAEGLVVLDSFTYIADERGGNNKRGRVARYPGMLL